MAEDVVMVEKVVVLSVEKTVVQVLLFLDGCIQKVLAQPFPLDI